MFKQVQALMAISLFFLSCAHAISTNPPAQQPLSNEIPVIPSMLEIPVIQPIFEDIPADTSLIDRVLNETYTPDGTSYPSKIEFKSIGSFPEYRWSMSIHYGAWMLDWAVSPNTEEFFFNSGRALTKVNCIVNQLNCESLISAYSARNFPKLENYFATNTQSNLAHEPLGLNLDETNAMTAKLFQKNFALEITKLGDVVKIQGSLEDLPIDIMGTTFREAISLLN